MRLRRGRHRTPADGWCLLEFVSVLAGEPWSDHPRCVHPVLGAIARRVNDECTDEGRARLMAAAVPLIGTAALPEPISAVLVRICVEAALGGPVPEATARRLRRATRAGAGVRYRRLRAPSAAAEAVTVVARRGVHADQALVDLFAACVAACVYVSNGTFCMAPLDIIAAEDHHVCTPYGMQSTDIESG